MTELGLNSISAGGAVSAWFGFLFTFAILTYVFVNMFKNAMYSGVVTVEPESKTTTRPDGDDTQSD